ncbi:MAG: cytochrome c biogenesis protein ResB [Burkholderiaceae bacterium]|nr:cytochrome c biogenesis protein ResB [Burkholderiaceae bacterium]
MKANATAAIIRVATPVIAHLGSLRATLAGLALLAAVVLARPDWQALSLVIGALAINLTVALAHHPGLRRRLPLLVAHLALLALVVGVAFGRLTALDGHFELTQGLAFDGQLIDQASGPLYRPPLHRLAFRHEGFEIDYAPGRKRGATRNAVSWVDESGQARRAVIGDHRPLVLAGHRITTTPNKGFAPLLRWLPGRGEPLAGTVHLPSFPANELRQSREWALPDGRKVWVMLHTDETLIDPGSAGRFRLPDDHRLVVRLDDQRTELQPGQAWRISGGTLVYEGLRSWMGYRVAYDPTLPWLLAAALVAALALGLHYAQKFWLQLPARAVQPRTDPGELDG